MQLHARTCQPPRPRSYTYTSCGRKSQSFSSQLSTHRIHQDAHPLHTWTASAEAGKRQDKRRQVVFQIDSDDKNLNSSNYLSCDSVPQILRSTSVSDLNLQHLIASSSGASFVATVCNIADSLIGAFLTPETLKPCNDPEVQLSGNYAPVRETPPQRCVEVEGVLPPDLNGIYIRNGPNATRLFEREGYHMFDGDGMLHGIRIKAGKASYCSRYVRTSRFVQEELAGRPLFLKFFGGFYGYLGFARAGLVLVRAILGVLNMSEGWGLSNTSVCYFNGKVLSLSEDDMPYVVRVTNEGDFITLGRLQFSHKAPRQPASTNMCAHPKFDPATGEMFAFSFRPCLTPFSFYKVSPDGIKSRDVSIPLKEISFIHDFAITENYVIFPDNQFVIRPLKCLRGEMPVVCDMNKTPRFCLVHRDATMGESDSSGVIKAPAMWFEAPECNGYHCINAWEEGDEVVIITPVLSPPERFLEIPSKNITCHLTEVRLNLNTGSTLIRKLCKANLEFGTFNQNYTGRKIRYVYLAVGSYPELSGIVKVDLEAQSQDANSCIVAKRDFGQYCHGNEPFFVPRSTKGEDNNNIAEDEGYVLCLVHNQSAGVSHLLVMDAQSPSLAILASIKLPSRVPYGFHGCFIHEDQLRKQEFAFS